RVERGATANVATRDPRDERRRDRLLRAHRPREVPPQRRTRRATATPAARRLSQPRPEPRRSGVPAAGARVAEKAGGANVDPTPVDDRLEPPATPRSAPVAEATPRAPEPRVDVRE